MKRLGFLCLLLALALMLGGAAFAQNVGDSTVYFTNYFSGNQAGAPDETVRIINDGDTEANLYASIYVFNNSQELTECCSCVVTPDGLLSESVKLNLTANPITGAGTVPTNGVIKIISSKTESDASTMFAANTPTAGLRVWGTHVQYAAVAHVPSTVGGPFPTVSGTAYMTETKAADSNLSSSEQTLLQQLCLFDNMLSGKPCTCQPEDYAW